MEKKRIRFSYNDDLIFLQEFIVHNHLSTAEGWDMIKQSLSINLGKNISIRTLKQHLEIMLEAWLKKEETEKTKSGVEEPYSQRDQLLQKMSMCAEFKDKPKLKKKQSKDRQISELGKKARDKYTETLEPLAVIVDENNVNLINSPMDTCSSLSTYGEEHNDCTEVETETYNILKPIDEHATIIPTFTHDIEAKNSPSTSNNVQNTPGKEKTTRIMGPVRKRMKQNSSLRKNALEYLNNKSDRENEIKLRELQVEEKKLEIAERKFTLEERKIELEEKRFELEKLERLQRIDIEKKKVELDLEEKKTSAQLLKSQQTLLDVLVQNKLLQ